MIRTPISVPTKQAIVPRYGTESDRAGAPSGIPISNELHQTTDQHRLFLQGVPVSGGKYLGTVANQTARLALNTSQALGCWPGDFCYQTDTSTAYFCISNNGTSTGDWLAAGGVPTSSTAQATADAALSLARSAATFQQASSASSFDPILNQVFS